MRSAGVNWPFGPVVDLHTNFFSTGGIRRISADYKIVAEMVPYIIKGIHDAGCATSAKHFPGSSNDYRDSHFSPNVNTITKEKWYSTVFKVWQAAVDAGAMSLMTGHSHIPAFDDSCARDDIPRPATASKKIIDLARVDLKYDGVMITDAVNMKSLAAAFEHDDVYIECFLAGHDIILFTDNDYIDVMEKAVLDGRITEAQIRDIVENLTAAHAAQPTYCTVKCNEIIEDFALLMAKMEDKELSLKTLKIINYQLKIAIEYYLLMVLLRWQA